MPARLPTYRPGGSIPTLDRNPSAAGRSRFYQSREWRSVRLTHLVRRPFCADCLSEGRATRGEAVHHVLSLEDRPDLGLDLDNLETLCRAHHLARHAVKALR
mgnify:CR=1 FL=1